MTSKLPVISCSEASPYPSTAIMAQQIPTHQKLSSGHSSKQLQPIVIKQEFPDDGYPCSSMNEGSSGWSSPGSSGQILKQILLGSTGLGQQGSASSTTYSSLPEQSSRMHNSVALEDPGQTNPADKSDTFFILSSGGIDDISKHLGKCVDSPLVGVMDSTKNTTTNVLSSGSVSLPPGFQESTRREPRTQWEYGQLQSHHEGSNSESVMKTVPVVSRFGTSLLTNKTVGLSKPTLLFVTSDTTEERTKTSNTAVAVNSQSHDKSVKRERDDQNMETEEDWSWYDSQQEDGGGWVEDEEEEKEEVKKKKGEKKKDKRENSNDRLDCSNDYENDESLHFTIKDLETDDEDDYEIDDDDDDYGDEEQEEEEEENLINDKDSYDSWELDEMEIEDDDGEDMEVPPLPEGFWYKFSSDDGGAESTAHDGPIVGVSDKSRAIVGVTAEDKPIVGVMAEDKPIVGMTTKDKPIVGMSTKQRTVFGVTAEEEIPAEKTFGPLEGKLVTEDEGCLSPSSWELCIKGSVLLYIDGGSDWLSHIRCARNPADQNIEVVQRYGEIYYRTTKCIESGSELRVFYGEEYSKRVGFNTDLKDLTFHTDLKAYSCSRCEIHYSDPKLMLRHMKLSHQANQSSPDLRPLITLETRSETTNQKPSLEKALLNEGKMYRRRDQGVNLQVDQQNRNDRISTRDLPPKGRVHSQGGTLEGKESLKPCDELPGHATPGTGKHERNTDVGGNPNPVKEFFCQVCSKTFLTEGRLRAHKAFHDFTSDNGETRSPESTLKRNTEDHQENVFRCHLCNNIYLTQTSLDTHKMIKHDKGKYHSCNVCHVKFRYRKQMREHKKEHYRDQEITSQLKAYYRNGLIADPNHTEKDKAIRAIEDDAGECERAGQMIETEDCISNSGSGQKMVRLEEKLMDDIIDLGIGRTEDCKLNRTGKSKNAVPIPEGGNQRKDQVTYHAAELETDHARRTRPMMQEGEISANEIVDSVMRNAYVRQMMESRGEKTRPMMQEREISVDSVMRNAHERHLMKSWENKNQPMMQEREISANQIVDSVMKNVYERHMMESRGEQTRPMMQEREISVDSMMRNVYERHMMESGEKVDHLKRRKEDQRVERPSMGGEDDVVVVSEESEDQWTLQMRKHGKEQDKNHVRNQQRALQRDNTMKDTGESVAGNKRQCTRDVSRTEGGIKSTSQEGRAGATNNDMLGKRTDYFENTKRKYKCKQCSKLYASFSMMRIHEREEHGGECRYKCQHCPKQFMERSRYERHQQKHNITDKLFKCTECPCSFASEKALKNHYGEHTGLKPFKCPLCGKGFARHSLVNAHIRRLHQVVELKHPCKQCNKRFATTWDLKKHERRHDGYRPFKCEVCGQSFTAKHSLNCHMLAIHEKLKPYRCDICGKCSSLSHHHNAHLLQHKKKGEYKPEDVKDRKSVHHMTKDT